MGLSNNNPKSNSNNNKLGFVREKVFEAFPGLQLLATGVIDKTCCFSDAIHLDDDEYDLDNSIVLCDAFDEMEQEQQTQELHHLLQPLPLRHETEIVASKSLVERNTITPKVENYTYLHVAFPSLADDEDEDDEEDDEEEDEEKEEEERSAFYLKSPSFSAHTATTYCKSFGSTSSIFSHQTGSTIAWSDVDDDSDLDDEDDLEIRWIPAKTVDPSKLLTTTPQTKKTVATTTTSTTPSGGADLVRRWSGIDKDFSETVVAAPQATFYRDPMIFRRVQSDGLESPQRMVPV